MMLVKDLMSTPVYSLNDTDTMLSARSLMTLHRIRHIPITDMEGAFVGLLTHRDVLSATISQLADIEPETQKEIDAGIPIMEVMRTDVRTVSPDLPLREAAAILLEHKYGCLPVIAAGKLVGIITEADFLRLTIQLMDALDEAESAA